MRRSFKSQVLFGGGLKSKSPEFCWGKLLSRDCTKDSLWDLANISLVIARFYRRFKEVCAIAKRQRKLLNAKWNASSGFHALFPRSCGILVFLASMVAIIEINLSPRPVLRPKA